MNILEAKQHLKENGYCFFNLKDFKEEYFAFLKDYLMCNEAKNIQKAFKYLRADWSENDGETFVPKRLQSQFLNFEEANLQKEEILQKKKDGFKLSQLWFYTEPYEVEKIINKNDFLTPFLKKIFSDVSKNFYDLDENTKINHLLTLTYYDRGCTLGNHSDGYGGNRICACLMYLNESYNESDGGYLVLNNELKVLPEIGNFAIIDLTKFDVPHMVTEVTGGIGRYACLNFISTGETDWK